MNPESPQVVKVEPYECNGIGDVVDIKLDENEFPNQIDASLPGKPTNVHVQHFSDGSTRPKFCDHLGEGGECNRLQGTTHKDINTLVGTNLGLLKPKEFKVINKPCKLITE